MNILFLEIHPFKGLHLKKVVSLPLSLQATLRDVGSLVWLSVEYRLTSNSLSPWLEQVQDSFTHT